MIDHEEDASSPVPHRKVTGRVEGADARFAVYLPPAEQWEHRFHHYVYPLDDEHASDEVIAFAAASGAHVVQTSSPGGYEIDAAAATASRAIAAAHYGSSERIYGYLFGASGGGYQTLGAMENTAGVWDGAVPMVIGLPTSIPSSFFVRAFARFVLEERAPRIADAVAPGGSGDPYAGLDEVERAVLEEVTRLGLPLRAWEAYRYALGLEADDRLLGFVPVVQQVDPTYVEDFWTAEGYLGTERSPLGERFRAARTPDNEWELALLSYHRHQVPSRPGYVGYDQFRGPDGTPRHPQRAVELGPVISGQVCGTGDEPSHTGAVAGRIILLQNLLDPDGWPSHGHWYRQQVEAALGDEADDRFRLWFNDHADHHATTTAAKQHRIVPYAGILQQALQDVSAWAERGVPPAPSTAYELVDGQVEVTADARHRGGIQPVVELTVEGRTRAEVEVGRPVRLRAEVRVPPGTGRIVAAEWDDLGSGAFRVHPIAEPADHVVVESQVTFEEPGTHLPGLRVTSQRSGPADSPFTRVQALGRVRVTVA